VENGRKVTGKNPKSSGWNTASMFQFFSCVFLQNQMTFQPFSGRIRQFPEAAIIDLGCSSSTEL
jgi:hypothetical protein